MKKQLLLMSTIFTAVFYFSCKKDSTPAPGPHSGSASNIKTWAGGSGIATYTYDASGRCTQVSYSTGAKTTYEYLAGKVIQKQFNNNGVNDFTYNYELGNEGLIVKETWPSDPTFDEVSIYNSDQQIVKKVYHINGTTQAQDYFYSNGDCDSIRNSTNGTWNSTIIKSYYTDKPNSIGHDAQGLLVFGKSSKHLLKTEQYIFSDGSTTSSDNYTYEFDAMGRVIKQTDTEGVNIDIVFITYY